MPFSKLRNSLSNLATPFLANAINNFASKQGAKDAGKVAAQLKDKGPFKIDEAPSQKLIQNPLKFSPVQYPLDLGDNGQGHYILFESGFIGYSPQTSNLLGNDKKTRTRAATAKSAARLGDKSITTSGIALYMPNSIKATYTQNYEDDSAGIAGDVEAIGSSMDGKGSADQIKAALEGTAGIAIRKGKQLLGEAVQLVGLGDPIKFMMKRAGTAINPRNELFYEGPSMRDFTYTFDFWPRNMKEADAVRDIIKIFKYNSAPGFKDQAGALFEIPNYFKISYMYKGEVNDKLNLISACYCTGVDVNYAPDGQPSFFPDGQPVHTQLTVTFKEDRVLSKEDIDQGA